MKSRERIPAAFPGGAFKGSPVGYYEGAARPARDAIAETGFRTVDARLAMC